MKILALSPHGDDEALGCAGSLARWSRERNTVHICYVTRPWQPVWTEKYCLNREKEIALVHRILGCTIPTIIGFGAAKLYTCIHEVYQKIGQIVDDFDPDILLIPNDTDLHEDHQITHHAGIVASRNNDASVLAYEVLSETDVNRNLFNPNCYMKLEKIDLQTKLKTLKAYKSELKSFPHPRSLKAVTALAMKRGSAIRFPYAEAFEVLRMTMP